MTSLRSWLMVSALLPLVGCADSGESKISKLLRLSAEPAGSQSVADARANAQAHQEVVIVGRIGGQEKPWLEDSTGFWIADLSLLPCNEPGDPDGCPTPWDYCCERDRPQKIAIVKFVDKTGKVLTTPAKESLRLKELETVVVRGEATRDDDNNLIVLANGVFVRPEEKSPSLPDKTQPE